jgi:two-component system, NtrC family, response regulator
LFLHLFKVLKQREKKAANEDFKVVKLNLATFEKELIRSELFGIKKGAFTGAIKDLKGHIHEANKGVLILEEIGELSHELQAKLLTFIEDGEFTRVGSTKPEKAKVQIIGTTNRAEEGAFREDFKARFRFFKVPPHI